MKVEDIQISIKEKRILEHTLGIQKYKKFPKEFYRNHFAAINEKHGDYTELASLEKKGLIRRYTNIMSSLCFVVTDLGIELVRSMHQ